MRKVMLFTFVLVLLTLTLTPLAIADIAIFNSRTSSGSPTRSVLVSWGYYESDPHSGGRGYPSSWPAGVYIGGYRLIRSGESSRFNVPSQVMFAYFRIQRGWNQDLELFPVDKHERKNFYAWIHPGEGFNAVTDSKGNLFKPRSNQIKEGPSGMLSAQEFKQHELVKKRFYRYPNYARIDIIKNDIKVRDSYLRTFGVADISITPKQIVLRASKRKLDSATLINGLVIDKSRMVQYVRKGKVIANSFKYYGDNHFLLLDQFKNTCGTTSAEMVLHYYGKEVGQAEIWDKGGVHNVEAGSFPWEIVDALNGLGVPATRDTRGTFESLKYYVRENRPPIVLLRFEDFLHYVVVVGYNDQGDFLIADPNNVFRWLSSDEMWLGWSLNAPGLPNNKYKARGLVRMYAMKVGTPFVDVLTGGENFIVPKHPPTHRFAANWSELRAVEVIGSRDLNPFFNTRGWERTLDFAKDFQDYRVSSLKPASVSNAFGAEDAWIAGRKKIGSDKVKVWGRITHGKATRGKLWVFVRAYRHKK